MTYDEAVNWLYSRLPAWHRIGKAAYKADLSNTTRLDEYFGHPHKNYKTVHVAGTNGKGSVSHMLASILAEAGYRTGLYTSPHLKDFRERIKVNGVMIAEDDVIRFIGEHTRIVDEVEPSFFELTAAMAFDHFAREKVDVAVIETGMGGRLDSTNIITPVLSVITNIGHDHMEFLGSTLAAVAGEKAGIIKTGVPVVIGETQEETREVFISSAQAAGSPIVFADIEYNCIPGEPDPMTGIRSFDLWSASGGLVLKGKTPLGGLAQQKNIQTVASAADRLSVMPGVNRENIASGIEKVIVNTGLSGRWQILSLKPFTVCDTGHNMEGLAYVMRQLASLHKDRLRMVIGFVNDKDLGSVLPLFPADAEYYFTRASIPRALDQNFLMSQAETYGLHGRAFDTVESALGAARREAAPDDVIFIGGSTFVVAEVV